MAFPFFENMGTLSAKAVGAAAKTSGTGSPMRMVCIGNPLGLMPDSFFPRGEGPNYELSDLLRPIGRHRKDFTVFSNLDHDISGGHSAVHAFLSGIKDQDSSDWPEGNISVDQRAAEFVGARTRYSSLVMSTGSGDGDLKCKLSWTRNGVNVPPVTRARDLFKALFVQDDPRLLAKRKSAYDVNESILDAVNSQAKMLSRQLGKADQEKLDEYLNSVREVERKLGMSREWLHKPKPEVDIEEPGEGDLTYTVPAFYDLLARPRNGFDESSDPRCTRKCEYRRPRSRRELPWILTSRKSRKAAARTLCHRKIPSRANGTISRQTEDHQRARRSITPGSHHGADGKRHGQRQLTLEQKSASPPRRWRIQPWRTQSVSNRKPQAGSPLQLVWIHAAAFRAGNRPIQ